MSASTELLVGVAIAAPLLSFVGAWAGVAMGRRTARELDVWRRREETMRLLRWATELAVDDDERKAAAGLATLDGLQDSPDLLQTQDLELVAAVTDAVLEVRIAAYDEQTSGARDAEVTYPDPGYPDSDESQ